VQGEPRQPPAGRGQAATGVDRAEHRQQRRRLRQGVGPRRLEPAEAVGPRAVGKQRQDGRGQVDAFDFGQIGRGQRRVFGARPQAQAAAGAVLPARPARWSAEARLMLLNSSRSEPQARVP
jgi:hypothetical protein